MGLAEIFEVPPAVGSIDLATVIEDLAHVAAGCPKVRGSGVRSTNDTEAGCRGVVKVVVAEACSFARSRFLGMGSDLDEAA
jgi:hypothetical protein